jgi:2-C-methyl-D-erythritol 2,4-cyclodiphosphate synthase
MQHRIGQGHDIHRTVDGRPLMLGGVRIEAPFGLLGHSDGDVVLHSICDAILGALGRGDIGNLFPDTDERYRGADSADLLRQVVERMRNASMRIGNVDITVSAERPRLAPYREAICRRVAELLGAELATVNLKAKTNEGLDAVGRGEAIAANVIVLLVPAQS